MSQPPFTALAEVYDAIMADVEYDDWADFVLRQATRRGWNGGAILDLGCGTGNFAIPLHRRGFEVGGLDASAAMLAVARRKEPEIDWRLGRFTDFELERRFTLVVSVFDSLNNLLTPDDFGAAARRVLDHLEPGGFFVFDVNTPAGLRDLWEGGRAEGWAGEVYYRWLHSFDEETGLARVDAYCDTGERSFSEVHFERPYDAGEVAALLASAGFEGAEAITYPEAEPAEADAPRIWVVARRPLQARP